MTRVRRFRAYYHVPPPDFRGRLPPVLTYPVSLQLNGHRRRLTIAEAEQLRGQLDEAVKQAKTAAGLDRSYS